VGRLGRGAESGLRRTLTFFLESQLALLVVVLVLSSTTILASLCANLSVVVRREEPWLGLWRCALTFPLFLGILTVVLYYLG
jgi:hypothetical protein